MTTKETTPEDAYRILAQERMERKQACTQEFQQSMQELLKKHACDMEIIQTNSSLRGTSYQIIFNPK